MSWRNGKHINQWINTLKTYAFPQIGNLKICDVEPQHIQSILQDIWFSKPTTGRRVAQRLEKVMDWAVANNMRTDNPVSSIIRSMPKQKSGQTHMRFLPYNLVAECIASVWKSEANETTKLAIEFLILTAARSGEVRLASWSEIDLENKKWSIPAERMKAGKAHNAPLSNIAIELLQLANDYCDGSDLIFPSTKHGKPISDMTLSKLVKSLGFDTTIHGFRTSFKMWAIEKTDYPSELSERALAHTIKNKVEAAYNRSDQYEQRIPIMNEWANYLDYSEICNNI